MQAIPATSGLPATTTNLWRDVIAAQRDLQKARGQTPGARSETVIQRPVDAVSAAERGTILSGTRGGNAIRLADDPNAPTGPRPTFQRTPLEQMRNTALEPVIAPTPPAQASEPAEAAPTPARGTWEGATATGALYDGSKRFAPDGAAGAVQIDIIT